MTSTLVRCYPGDQVLDFFLVVTLGVALAASAGWLSARRLAGKAALRHRVLFSALICCLASPAVAWFCNATGLKLVSFPLLCEEQARMPSGVTQIETDLACMPTRPSTDAPAVVAELPLPPANPTTDPNAESAVAPVATQSSETPTPSAPDVPGAGRVAPTFVSFRGIATGAMLLWAAGAVLMLARLGRSCWRVVLLRRWSRPVASERLQALLHETAARLGMRQVPLLLVSSRTVIPLAVGFGRAAIILPQRLLGAVSDNELRDVLMHEMAHLERGDQRMVLLQELAGALYWPMVPVHALKRELRRACEEVCDNVVLAGRDAISYGETLLHVAELLVKARPLDAAVGILGGPGELERRISGLIDPRRNTMTKIGRKTAGIVMFLFIALGAIASTTRFAASADAQPATPAPPPAQTQAAPPLPKPPPASGPDDPRFARHFRGRVTGPDGKPVKNARVFVAPTSDGFNGALAVRASTDADGRFDFDAGDMTYLELDGLPARRDCIVSATADGYGPDWIYPSDKKTTALTLQLAKDDVPIHGRFLDAAGRPLAGVRVRLTGLMIPKGRDLDAHLDREAKSSILA